MVYIQVYNISSLGRFSHDREGCMLALAYWLVGFIGEDVVQFRSDIKVFSIPVGSNTIYLIDQKMDETAI